jgi:signal transduction histidine kinase
MNLITFFLLITAIVLLFLAINFWVNRPLKKLISPTQGQLIQDEKLNAVEQLASGVAHEVKNPLAIIMQSADYLADNLPAEHKDILLMITNNVKRVDNIIRALVEFSRVIKLNIIPEDINLIIESSLILIQQQTDFENIKITKELQTGLPKVLVDNNKMEQVLVNIFLNAIQAMPRGGNLFIRTYITEFNTLGDRIGRRSGDVFKIGEKAVVIEIEDTGVGISEENLKKAFDPFFTTKGPKGGVGLGLSVSKNIITMHKGLIEIKSKVGQGTKVSITLKVGGGA